MFLSSRRHPIQSKTAEKSGKAVERPQNSTNPNNNPPIQRLIDPFRFREQSAEPTEEQRVFRYSSFIELQKIEALLDHYNQQLHENGTHAYQEFAKGKDELRPYSVVAETRRDRDHQSYASPPNEAIAHKMLDILYQLETYIYKMFEPHTTFLFPQFVVPEKEAFYRKPLLRLLNDIQSDHRKIITFLREEGHRIWVPGINSFGQSEKDSVYALWDKLQSNTSGIRVSDKAKSGRFSKEKVSGFADRVHAMHAKLMYSRSGRELLRSVMDNNDHPLNVAPNPLAEAYEQERIQFDERGLFTPGKGKNTGASPTLYLPHAIPDTQLVGMGYDWEAVATSPTPVDTSGRGSVIDPKVLPRNPKITSPRVSAAKIHLSSSSSDSSDDESDAVAGTEYKHGNYVLHPGFIRYAKQLAYARNAQEGTSRVKGPLLHEKDIPWGTPEEQEAVTFVENPIRVEHQLAKRKWMALYDARRLGW
ncbi:hypothetical protein FUAX_48950 (plasmid) [Fulvitalea axinellae]|uniref:Uncharacterized protein n=1 Tax=Fulvitalea axinellae TaxID=1182444 RepID=A0AAU9CQI0_9BACT|nr:hypothetical protein FUAX_48950 [Fulvitalea axinellae]